MNFSRARLTSALQVCLDNSGHAHYYLGMPLTELWKNNLKELEKKHVQQVIGFAGDGKLKDGGIASKEFRELLAVVPSAVLTRYADETLKEKFESGGLALQDVINQVGVRLGFKVDQGRYRGVIGEIGFDGLWHAPEENCIVIEVKTTDAYRIDLETLAVYRRKLITDKKIAESKSSILIVVGRSDTGDLEAQVRGSRHAWDIRLISIDFLLRLMRLKEELEDPKIMDKIRRVLMPQEFTRVDGIIDLVFAATEEVKKDDEEPATEGDDGDGLGKQPKFIPSNFRDACAARVQAHLRQSLVKRSSAVFSSPDDKVVLVCLNSREYHDPNGSGFWFAFHPHQRDIIEKPKSGYIALGCGSKDSVLLIPASKFLQWLNMLNKTELVDRFYWHVKVNRDSSGYKLRVRKGFNPVALDSYLI